MMVAKNEMKIALVVPKFPIVSETFIYYQAIALVDKGHKVTIFAFHDNTEDVVSHKVVHELKEKALIEYYPKTQSQKTTSYLLKYAKKFLENISWVSERKSEHLQWLRIVQFYSSISIDCWLKKLLEFDIIHVHHGPCAIPVAKSFKTLKNGCPSLIISFHGLDLSPNRINQASRLYSALFDIQARFIVNTPYLADLFSSAFAQKGKLYIIPVGLDTAKFKPKASTIRYNKSDSFNIIFCGRLIELKGPEFAILTMEFLRDNIQLDNITLTIAGSGPLKSKMILLVKKLGLQDKVKFVGSVSQEQLIHLLDQAHLFFLPGVADPVSGRSETQGLVIQEAQAMGVPVLISDAGGMRYGMIHNETGFCVEQKNISEFAKAINLLIENEDLRQTMGKSGRNFVSKNYDIKIIIDQLEKVYKDSMIN